MKASFFGLYSHLNGVQAPHIDRTDFLNGVVREKKRFENVLDESVAAGLNAGTDVLMNQVGEFCGLSDPGLP
jgi:hypothetical protein